MLGRWSGAECNTICARSRAAFRQVKQALRIEDHQAGRLHLACGLKLLPGQPRFAVQQVERRNVGIGLRIVPVVPEDLAVCRQSTSQVAAQAQQVAAKAQCVRIVWFGSQGVADGIAGCACIIAEQGQPCLAQVGLDQLGVLVQGLAVKLAGVFRFAQSQQSVAAPGQNGWTRRFGL